MGYHCPEKFTMSSLENSIFLKALHKQAIDRTPVWVMRQAGRYLPEYRAVRQQAGDFLSLCKNPELACEVTLQPLRRFSLDAAIVFSDILTIPDAMGLGLYFVEGEGPCFRAPLQSVEAIKALPNPDIKQELSYVMEAIKLIRQSLPTNIPLIGFSGSPWTLACYMVEGRSSHDFARLQRLLIEQPLAAKQLLNKLTQSVIDYLIAQAQAGANVLMIFDTWGGMLSTENYFTYSLSCMEKIVREVKQVCPHTPLILFTKGGGQWLENMAQTGCDALGLDWTCDLGAARARVGKQVALQGNLHPSILLQDPAIIRAEVGRVLEAYGPGSGHIFNLGHGITPDVPPAHLQVMLEAVRELSPDYHR